MRSNKPVLPAHLIAECAKGKNFELFARAINSLSDKSITEEQFIAIFPPDSQGRKDLYKLKQLYQSIRSRV